MAARKQNRDRSAAIARARRAVERLVLDEAERDELAEAVSRYGDACQLVADLRREWTSLGGPLLTEGSMRQTIPHPLVKMIADAEKQAAEFGRLVGIDIAPRVVKKTNGGAGGRPVASSSAPDRVAPARLTMVKGGG